MERREEPGKVRAGVYAALVHLAFIALMIFGVSWQNRQSAPVAVELWDSLPVAQPAPRVAPKPEPRPEPRPEPKPVVKPEPKPEPKAKPEPQPAKPDIALKAKEKEKEARRREEEQKKAAEEKRKQEDARRQEQERQKQQALQQKQAEQALRAQQEMAATLARQQAAAQGRLVDDYQGKITGKIKRLINNQACLPLGNPEVRFDVTLMPTGELLMEPKLTKSSGNGTCDQAIERAILRAQPLPLPPDPTLFSRFRELHLKFRPNENE